MANKYQPVKGMIKKDNKCSISKPKAAESCTMGSKKRIIQINQTVKDHHCLFSLLSLFLLAKKNTKYILFKDSDYFT